MAKELPYFKFEPNEWENGNIQMLSREHKGLFIDLCSMYWSRLGDLPLRLATQKLCGGNATALNSLYEENVIDISEGYIFIKFLSEQLNEFKDLSNQNSKNAKEGWEKRRKQKELCDRNATALNSQSENDAIREEKRIEKKIKEQNIQNQDFANEVLFEELETKNQKKIEKVNHSEIVKIFNEVCVDLPKVIVLSDKRKKLISDRVKQFDLETIGRVFTKVSESDFLNGKSGKFTASFDWIFKHENFVKILEDNYKNKTQKPINKPQNATEALKNRLQQLGIPTIKNY